MEIYKVKLKPYQLHLGDDPVIDMEELFYLTTIHNEWQLYDDEYQLEQNGSGEYKDIIYYTYDAHYALELIDTKFAVLKKILTKKNKIEYHLIMRENY